MIGLPVPADIDTPHCYRGELQVTFPCMSGTSHEPHESRASPDMVPDIKLQLLPDSSLTRMPCMFFLHASMFCLRLLFHRRILAETQEFRSHYMYAPTLSSTWLSQSDLRFHLGSGVIVAQCTILHEKQSGQVQLPAMVNPSAKKSRTEHCKKKKRRGRRRRLFMSLRT